MEKIIEYQKPAKNPMPPYYEFDGCEKEEATHAIVELGFVKGVRKFKRIKL